MQNGERALKQSLLTILERKRLDQILRSAISQLVAGSVEAGIPLMRWRAAGGSGLSTLQRLLEMLLAVCEEPTFEASALRRIHRLHPEVRSRQHNQHLLCIHPDSLSLLDCIP